MYVDYVKLKCLPTFICSLYPVLFHVDLCLLSVLYVYLLYVQTC